MTKEFYLQTQPLIQNNSSINNQKKIERNFHDIFFGVIFLCIIIGMFIISGISYKNGNPQLLLPSKVL